MARWRVRQPSTSGSWPDRVKVGAVLTEGKDISCNVDPAERRRRGMPDAVYAEEYLSFFSFGGEGYDHNKGFFITRLSLLPSCEMEETEI